MEKILPFQDELQDLRHGGHPGVDDRVHPDIAHQGRVIGVVHQGHYVGTAGPLGEQGREDVGLVIVGDRDKGVVAGDHLRLEELPVHGRDVQHRGARQPLAQAHSPLLVGVDELDVHAAALKHLRELLSSDAPPVDHEVL